jgi:chemotaxis protein methyltransferase CheR
VTDPTALERFRAYVQRRLGLRVEDDKLAELDDLLHERARASAGGDREAYLRIAEREGSNELRVLARALTVGETYFYRHVEHFAAFMDIALRERPSGRPLRVLSAGCATGEEAYTIAILMRERGVPNVEITGIDINPASIEHARAARYSPWALRETPASIQQRYFRAAGNVFVLDRTLAQEIAFTERNLVEDDASFWREGAFDAIFCRNVLMYFSLETARATVARLEGSLRPHGHLFLGHAETLRALSQRFHLQHTHDTFYYQRRDREDGDSAAAIGDWQDQIARASRRIEELTGSGVAAVAPVAAAREVDLAPPLELLRQERFAECADWLRARATHNPAPALHLLLGVALMNAGALEDAERVCTELLHRDELNAGAHYLLALAREHAHDAARAIEHDRTAAYLDESFAMPRLHLGLLARRAGDRVSAQRELERALHLLSAETSTRLLLFGGGFSRESLVQLCRAELRACGETP